MYLGFLAVIIILAVPPCWAEGTPYGVDQAVVSFSRQMGPTDPQELEAFLDEVFAKYMEELHVPGAVFVLVKDGEIFFTKGYGFANLEERRPIVPDETLFPVGSISKLFTATAVMQLSERGLLRLDDDVNLYLKLFKLEDNYPAPITFANLLTHTAGFDDRYIGTAVRSKSEVIPLGQYLATRMPPRVLPPGDVISYSNHGFALAGYLVEEISGTPFAQYIHENILQPIGMHRSSFLPSSHLAPHLAVGYEYRNGVYRRVPFDYLNLAPSGGLVATATDIARFMIAHLNDGCYQGSCILEETTVLEMHRQHFTHHPKLPGIAYSFYESFKNNQRAIWHSGALRGFASYLFLLPEHELGIFISINALQPKLCEEVVREFLDHYYPVQEGSASLQLSDFKDRVSRFTGTYRLNRYPRYTFDKLPILLLGFAPELRVAVEEDTLIIRGGGLDEASRWVEVGPLLFQRVNSSEYLAFREDERGRITYMFIGPWAFERLSWYETLAFHRVLVIFFILVFLSACIPWLSTQQIRSLQVQRSVVLDMSNLARMLAGLMSTLNILFLVGIAVALQKYFWELRYGVPSIILALLCIPLLTVVLTAGALILGIMAWKEGYWSTIGRLHYSLVLLAALAFIPFLLYWNLLGFRF
jgi:CubicO group peptidase (beta-lactamase class C family)